MFHLSTELLSTEAISIILYSHWSIIYSNYEVVYKNSYVQQQLLQCTDNTFISLGSNNNS